jgi:aspartokinase
MPPPTKLGGFKILKDVVLISTFIPDEKKDDPARFFRVIAEEKINLPYVTCIHGSQSWGLNLMVNTSDKANISQVIEKNFGKIFQYTPNSAILSIFPHRKNPEITGSLFEAFGQQGLKPDSVSNSPSAISVVLKEEILNRASSALFEPFSFSAYRTPADWKLAQKGKESLYKEVVASYQEKKPKVYGLEYHEKQEFLKLILNINEMAQYGEIFKKFSQIGLHFTFIVTSPLQEEEGTLAFCLPVRENRSNVEILNPLAPEVMIDSISPVSIFSMNGPHFGDRYGIVSELLTFFANSQIDLLSLCCTIASITGVVPSHQLESTIQTIQSCFEVPSVIKKE